MSFVLRKISKTTLVGIKDNWCSQLESIEDSEYLYSTIDRMVDWCEKVIEEKQTNLWEVCKDGDDIPRAIVELVDARMSKDPSFKFLNF